MVDLALGADIVFHIGLVCALFMRPELASAQMVGLDLALHLLVFVALAYALTKGRVAWT